MKLARDAALGMLWLHSSNPQIIHRDLKASNLLIDSNLNCKICDFGKFSLLSLLELEDLCVVCVFIKVRSESVHTKGKKHHGR